MAATTGDLFLSDHELDRLAEVGLRGGQPDRATSLALIAEVQLRRGRVPCPQCGASIKQHLKESP